MVSLYGVGEQLFNLLLSHDVEGIVARREKCASVGIGNDGKEVVAVDSDVPGEFAQTKI